MSIRRAVSNLALAAAIVVASQLDSAAWAAESDGSRAIVAAADSAGKIPPLAPPYAMLIARVFVNTVNRGDLPVLRDASGRFFIPQPEFDRWGLAVPHVEVVVAGERYVAVSEIEGLAVRFDPIGVTLSLQVAAKVLPRTAIDLGPQHRPGVVYPEDSSFFLNYGLNANGDDSFGQRRYQFATELGVRAGAWLFYNTTDEQWGNGANSRFTRLLTNAQYDDRPNLRRLTLGDFFTPTLDLDSSVALGGVSFTKFYTMDPYFIQYPTAAFQAEVAFPSTVQVRVDGNLIAQRQIQPGPIDITNITGVTGGQSVSVVIRDPFGREQVLQRPFFFATNAGLAQGLHEYSYNVGFLRRDYGVESANYGPLAASAFHRYAFSDQLTLGARGQVTDRLYNVGPFGTYQGPWGIVGGGVSIGGRNGDSGPAATAAYSYTGGNFSLNLGYQYLARHFAQLSDFESTFRTRSNEYASASAYSPALGTLTATYTAMTTYEGPRNKLWNLTYTRGLLDGKALFSANYTRTMEPQSTSLWLVSLRYFFDSDTSLVASAGGTTHPSTQSQSLSLEKAVPQGEGVGYTLTGGHFHADSDGAFGRAFVQANAAHVTVGADYARASPSQAGPGLSQVFVAGSIGAVGGSVFAARPVTDSFALIRLPELRDVPVYANGWYAGKTDARGEVVATNIASYYDNFIAFGTRELPLEYVFPSSEKVISPPTRSGTLVAFEIRKNHAVFGAVVESRKRTALEFRELTLTRGDTVIRAFTARRGEFYVEGVTPGAYQLRVEGEIPCTARITVPDPAEAMTDVGTVLCEAAPR
jgi:outer membrane usher protein FimD/PapC